MVVYDSTIVLTLTLFNYTPLLALVSAAKFTSLQELLSDDFKDKFAFAEKEFWESVKCDLMPVLQNLKHISIYFLSGTEQNDMIVTVVMEELENKIEFAGFLLKNTKALERIDGHYMW
ncbi:hypothetical protein IFM89_015904 [Coptis chinensis]|uniref:Uncharacterized protein n=1 Tax=Coptis chinensis TaxID=261450 RepID=A0A835LRC5_9MAGN|nr:hypothetical protein IFM89_015904 [Coptis chinensis]